MAKKSFTERIERAHESGFLGVYMLEHFMRAGQTPHTKKSLQQTVDMLNVMYGVPGSIYNSAERVNISGDHGSYSGMSFTVLKKDYPVELWTDRSHAGLALDLFPDDSMPGPKPELVFFSSVDAFTNVLAAGDQYLLKSFADYDVIEDIRKIQNLPNKPIELPFTNPVNDLPGDPTHAVIHFWTTLAESGWNKYFNSKGYYQGTNEGVGNIPLQSITGVIVEEPAAPFPLPYKQHELWEIGDAIKLHQLLHSLFPEVFPPEEPLPLLYYRAHEKAFSEISQEKIDQALEITTTAARIR